MLTVRVIASSELKDAFTVSSVQDSVYPAASWVVQLVAGAIVAPKGLHESH